MKPLPPPLSAAAINNASHPAVNILGVPIHTLPKSKILESCRELFLSGESQQIITANALMLLESERQPELKEVCRQASLVLSDSAGISWATRRLKLPTPPRTPGIDLAFDLCGLAAELELPIYLIGGAPGVPEKAAKFLQEKFPTLQIAGTSNGYFSEKEEERLLQDVAAKRPRLTLVALGMPAQDFWIHTHRSRLPPGIAMGVGGTFDIWSGRLKRAPRWLQTIGLEWLFRWIQQPARSNRMLKLPLFALRILRG